MQQILREYGGAVLAAVGAFLIFAVLGGMILAKNGLLATMVLLWGIGGL